MRIKSMNYKFIRKITYLAILILVTALGIYISQKYNLLFKNAEELTTVKESNNKIGCTRKTRLVNEPQYDRAFSIIQQRIKENNERWENTEPEFEYLKFDHFPHELVNCIKITEEETNKNDSIEGYFTFNSKDIKENFYPITISSKYEFEDDIVTALLLTHELTHVEQYINETNKKKTISCVEKEVDAFITQLDFYTELNTGENSSIYYRMNNDPYLTPQIQMIKAMTTINRESNCDFLDHKCKDNNLRIKLVDMINNDEYYKKQCNL